MLGNRRTVGELRPAAERGVGRVGELVRRHGAAEVGGDLGPQVLVALRVAVHHVEALVATLGLARRPQAEVGVQLGRGEARGGRVEALRARPRHAPIELLTHDGAERERRAQVHEVVLDGADHLQQLNKAPSAGNRMAAHVVWVGDDPVPAGLSGFLLQNILLAVVEVGRPAGSIDAGIGLDHRVLGPTEMQPVLLRPSHEEDPLDASDSSGELQRVDKVSNHGRWIPRQSHRKGTRSQDRLLTSHMACSSSFCR